VATRTNSGEDWVSRFVGIGARLVPLSVWRRSRLSGLAIKVDGEPSCEQRPVATWAELDEGTGPRSWLGRRRLGGGAAS
jgi:hypothetical protein